MPTVPETLEVYIYANKKFEQILIVFNFCIKGTKDHHHPSWFSLFTDWSSV